MDIRKKIRIALIGAALLVLIGSIALSAYLFFSNYQNVQLFRQAENNLAQGDPASLDLAEAQLHQLVRNDHDNERAFILLARIAGKKKIYPEQVYYTLQAHKLNPLSEENEKAYIESLLCAREFERLENFLANKNDLNAQQSAYLLYAAGQNGDFAKYRHLIEKSKAKVTPLSELTTILFQVNKMELQERNLQILQKEVPASNTFVLQEIAAAQAKAALSRQELEKAEKYLLQAYKLNEFAFAPPLGRFYANYRSMGKALEIFEKYLATYHDPAAALQTGEIYCLLKKRDKIAALNKQYQADSGKGAMLLNYYFEVLNNFAANDMAACKQYLAPLQKAVHTPLATFIYFQAKLSEDDLSGVHKYYNELLAHRAYLDLQMRADQSIIALIKRAISANKTQEPLLLELAEKVYWRAPDPTVGKFLLLSQRQKRHMNLLLLGDLLKRFPKDQGVNKIAVEHYLSSDLASAEKLIADYMKNFPKQQSDMLRYRIILAIRQKKFDQVSRLFRQNFSPGLSGEYWNFAISSKRIEDLRFLARDRQYKPFCEAAILLAENKKEQALEILSKADAGKNQTLLFYAARTLAENDRLKEALVLYSKFPENSVYKLNVLLNSSELYWELGNQLESLRLAKKAYRLAPETPEVQFCYADKLCKSKQFNEIPDIVKLTNASPYNEKMRSFLISSLEFRLKNCDLSKDKEKILNTADHLLRIVPDNKLALEYRQKVLSIRKKE